MSHPTPSALSEFINYHHFTSSPRGGSWFCNLCTPEESGRVQYMSTSATLYHERHSKKHARLVSDTEIFMNPDATPSWEINWDAPIEPDHPHSLDEAKLRESQSHVDNVKDMIPFWMKAVEAAGRGEILKLEDFLDEVHHDESSDPWATSGRDINWGCPCTTDDGQGKPNFVNRWDSPVIDWHNGSLSSNGQRTPSLKTHESNQGWVTPKAKIRRKPERSHAPNKEGSGGKRRR